MDAIDVLGQLIRIKSITPDGRKCLDLIADILKAYLFDVTFIKFEEVENLYATRGANGPRLLFGGHVDVVPPGAEEAWSHPPFSGAVEGGTMYGRGAVDMKGAIACYLEAICRFLEKDPDPSATLSLLITCDEEGLALNGTLRTLDWAAKNGHRWDYCIVGEPTSSNALGDVAKVGRRGSLSGEIVVRGVQGHVAYQSEALNPIVLASKLVCELSSYRFDQGNSYFEPTNLEFTTIDVNNSVTNLIPEQVSMAFNVRFNSEWDIENLKNKIIDVVSEVALLSNDLSPKDKQYQVQLIWREGASESFLSKDEQLISAVKNSVAKVTGKAVNLTTGGGTSDARFVKNYCPVVEFGLVGQTMHKVDERVELSDLHMLTKIYEAFIEEVCVNKPPS
ncbi:succinyl-diaminopimelate desuccinylase [Rhizobium sp. FKY42]|uniref:succinyl-diaminopimelate desuccinylase n=1 Tax=Rhizobium sp. FKY42 TaxID=2562310 RepID=UPI001FEEC5EA|nr:succinyl-diaminopimelate desuccinylase [Rhizobium sp. FKY42]